MLIKGTMEAIESLGIRPKSLRLMADVGTGPNLYPAMLLAPFIMSKDQGARIDLIEYAQPNLSYLHSLFSGHSSLPPADIWDKFETFMTEYSSVWRGTLNRMRSLAKVCRGSIFNLRPDTYDAISSFFVPESITESRQECDKAINCLLSAVKPGGLVIVGHMLNSTGYPAGANRHFPAVPLTIDDLRQIYKGKLESVTIVEPPLTPEVRDDYEGAAVVVGVRSKKPDTTL